MIGAIAVLMMIGGGVMLFVATDNVIRQLYRNSMDRELDSMRERDGENQKK